MAPLMNIMNYMTIKRYWTICKISSDLLDIWMTGRRWPTTCQYSVALSALLASTPFGHQCDDYDKISDHDDICDDYDQISDNNDICDDYDKISGQDDICDDC